MASWIALSPFPGPEKQEALILVLLPTQTPFGLVSRPERTGGYLQTRDTTRQISCPGPKVLGVSLSQVPPELAMETQRIRGCLQTTAMANWVSWYSPPRLGAPECPLKPTQPGLASRVQMSDGRPWATASWISSQSLAHSGARGLGPIVSRDQAMLASLEWALGMRSG